MTMTRTRYRLFMSCIAVALVLNLWGIASDLSEDSRGTWGTLSLGLRVISVLLMITGLGLMMRAERRGQIQD